ncbi:MAG: arginine--tRNA ligase [Candidatus Kapabacteria bacterium]|nr:arginine--tRNA ligase [Candidatus Kapabacteria bacterium]
MELKDYTKKIIESALNKAGISFSDYIIEEPKNPEFGDLSSNIAMTLAKTLKKAPRTIAEELIKSFEFDNNIIEEVSIAGQGFINFKFSKKIYPLLLSSVIEEKENYGKNNSGEGKRVNVEYVSVNPTGLLHLGHGRNACIGDTIANLYKWNGWDVTREYYFNNAGNQMKNLALSIYARYRQQLGETDFPFPEDGYHGEYIKTIAAEIIEKYGSQYQNGTDDDLNFIRKFGENWCFDKIKATLKRLNIKQDVFFNEDSLYHDGKIDKLIADLKRLDLVYEKDGALWLALSKMGLKDDRVIVKSSGEPTYRLPDIAYHRDKFERGFDLLIDIFGADHIATIPDVLAAIKYLGFDSSKVRVLIHQFVTLTENGEQVKMSKRTGKSYTLDDLLDEVGEDVVRFFLIMRGISTHLEFDLGLAREQSEKNPVFYLQYAHARICSVLDLAKERGINLDRKPNLSILENNYEIDLIKKILKFKETVTTACDKCEPQILADYLRELANAFHIFYHECRILGVEEELQTARLNLALATKITLKNGLSILGINAPERM